MPAMTGLPAGLVLAGGRSSRLGGGDKPMRLVGGKPMLGHVLDRLVPQAGPVAISANGEPTRFSGYRLPVLADNGPAGQAGPLAGVLAGLEWARQIGCRHLLAVAGDTPFFPRDLGARLSEAAAGERIAIAASGGRPHPVFGLWPVSIAGDLSRFLETSPTFSVMAFLAGRSVATVDFPMYSVEDDCIDPFFNVNTPEELALAETIHRKMTA